MCHSDSTYEETISIFQNLKEKKIKDVKLSDYIFPDDYRKSNAEKIS